MVTPTAPTAPVDPLPPANPKAFTAASPTLDTVSAFLNQLWGFDPKRVWRVMGIQPTPAEGVSEVVVFVTSTDPNSQIQSVTFYVLPDGKHAIGEGAGVLTFGATPFAETRALLQARANGAFRGATSKDLELVEFTDLQCPHCKEAEPTMNQLVKDFPAARVVVQLLPLTEIHPSAFKAAAYGVCAQMQSNDAYFRYAAGVFDTQEALAPATEDTLLRAAAKRAGLDGDAIASCAKTQAAEAIVEADIKLADEAGVRNTTPTLAVNGRLLPLGIPYDTLKQIIVYQAKLDGVATGASADILAPAPPPPATAAPNSPPK
jgi:protein-disulfide isomerase